jgi:hypothetical protein
MSFASFLPYSSIPAWWDDGLSTTGPPYSTYIASWSLADGYAMRLVIVLLAVLGVAAVATLFGIRRRFSAMVSLVFSIGLVLFALFESSDGGRHVLPSWVLPGFQGGEVAPVEPVTAGIGDAVFLVGAVLAVIASLIMVDRSVRGEPSRMSGTQPTRAAAAGPSS